MFMKLFSSSLSVIYSRPVPLVQVCDRRKKDLTNRGVSVSIELVLNY